MVVSEWYRDGLIGRNAKEAETWRESLVREGGGRKREREREGGRERETGRERERERVFY